MTADAAPAALPPNFFALLIGIDRYSQKPLSDGTRYPHLSGCVRDTNHVERLLRNALGLSDGQITKLISPAGEVDSSARLPTYANIIAAFKEITAGAQPGDQVYIHYSGHGGRSKTMFEQLKGASGLDESLVPCDIGENGACYLRDVEMAYLLKQMSDKGLIITLVLDSCHSGGATRGKGGAVPRCIPGFIDMTPPSKISGVAPSIETIISELNGVSSAMTRSAAAAAAVSGWHIPVPKNFVLLAACRANELANEYAFDGKERNGALTYCILDSLRQMGAAGYTYKMLYNRVLAKVHAKFVEQTPQLEGDGDREIFGAGRRASISAVNVLKVDLPNNRVRLNTGLAQEAGKGARFAVYAAAAAAAETSDSGSKSAALLAVVELEDAEAAESWAPFIDDSRASEIQEGSQAVLLSPGMNLVGRVRLSRQPADGVFGAAAQDAALDGLREVIGRRDDDEIPAGEKWIRLADEGEDSDFQVAVNQHGEYEIWDPNGKALPNLRPAVKINDDGAAKKVAERLAHLTKYRNVRLIDVVDQPSELAQKIVIELVKEQKNKQGGVTSYVPFGVPARPLSVGEKVFVRVINHSAAAVNITILDLQPDWGISQAYPLPREGEYKLLEPGADNALLVPMAAGLPDDYQEGTDTLKVFAAVEGTSFKWLELPALDRPSGGAERGSAAQSA